MLTPCFCAVRERAIRLLSDIQRLETPALQYACRVDHMGRNRRGDLGIRVHHRGSHPFLL